MWRAKSGCMRGIVGVDARGRVLALVPVILFGAAAAHANDCDALASYRAGDVRVDSAERVEAAGGPSTAAQPTEGARAAGGQPAHCKVAGTIEQEIRFELLLPDSWNGRFVMGGGGGFVGSVQNAAQTSLLHGGTALERGYATAGTDTGHQGLGTDASWALENPERELNFGHRAVHLVAEASKAILRRHYGRDAERSYFFGCSRGGGQGMMESQRYPEDFDGIVAGAPAYDWPGIGAGFVRTQQEIYPDPGDLSAPVITTANRALLAREITARCDALDGVADGVIDDPRRCPFDPAALPRCPSEEGGPECLTERQLRAVQAIYQGPDVAGKNVHPGFPFGGESDLGGWDAWITGRPNGFGPGQPSLHFAFGTNMFKYLIYDHPEWDYSKHDFSSWARWEKDTARAAKILNATDPDLSPFARAGGKLILWQGWSDPAITALGTIEYYEEVVAKDPGARDYARLFMMPGVLHCAGGPGPDRVDWLQTIADWVEQGQAPDRVAASRIDANGRVLRTRPLCPYPLVALWDGKGSTDAAESFTCGERE
ncbi:MAG TPA: tannase/feruloyl esterase family alpha/beta hydrolase [Thermoanaerobaculia bacterium]|nr:tannase/feruloyl esterase family alpha/beta hydrolase [Thermoanaerobaculia bacterium]